MQSPDVTRELSRPPVDESPGSAGGQAAAVEELSPFTRFKLDLVRMFLSGWARCFSLTGLYWLGRFFGTCEYLVDYKRRRRVRRRLKEIFPEGLSAARMRYHARRYFCRVRCDKMLYLIIDRVPREKLLRRIRFHGREHLETALGHGRGAFIMISHYGSAHVAGLMMALLGYRIGGVRDPKEAALRRYIQDRFSREFPEVAEMRVFYADTFPRVIYREFQENRILSAALDVDRFRGEHLKTCAVRMFGQEKQFLTGTLQIALRCGATVMQGFMISRKNYYFRWDLSAPLIDPDSARDEPAIVESIMARYAANIEQHARTYPCHMMRI